MDSIGKGLAIVGIWIGSALAVHFGAPDVTYIFGGAVAATAVTVIFF